MASYITTEKLRGWFIFTTRKLTLATSLAVMHFAVSHRANVTLVAYVAFPNTDLIANTFSIQSQT